MSRHISVYARFNLKRNKRFGVAREDWTFAKDSPLPFDVLVGAFTAMLAEFHLNTGQVSTVDEMNKLLEKTAEQIKTIRFEEKA